MTAASIVFSIDSSHSSDSMSRWFVGSSRSRMSGCDASARASDARVSSPPENVRSGRSRSSSVKPSPRTNDGGAVAPVVAAGVLELRLRLGVAAERRRPVVAAGHRPLERAKLVLDRREVGGAGEHVVAERAAALRRRPLVVERDPRALRPARARRPRATPRPRGRGAASSCPRRSGRRARAGRGARP